MDIDGTTGDTESSEDEEDEVDEEDRIEEEKDIDIQLKTKFKSEEYAKEFMLWLLEIFAKDILPNNFAIPTPTA
ncbi:hypothetical protein HK104_006475, partial [Borealophlyctis nickersoniae]